MKELEQSIIKSNLSKAFLSSTDARPAAARVDMAKTFQAINQMIEDGIIQSYAVGGATAAFFYVEPDTTFDVGIFCVSSGWEENKLDILGPLYEYLSSKKYEPQEDGVIIEGFRVQFLPVFDPLNDEAVQNANDLTYSSVPVRVMNPEYLVAIMLQTGRPKDYARVLRFLDADAFDVGALKEILSRHELESKLTILRQLGANI